MKWGCSAMHNDGGGKGSTGAQVIKHVLSWWLSKVYAMRGKAWAGHMHNSAVCVTASRM